jgi:hypothetical protein
MENSRKSNIIKHLGRVSMPAFSLVLLTSPANTNDVLVSEGRKEVLN